MNLKICVIGLQGDVTEHIHSTEKALKELKLYGNVLWARSLEDLDNANGIILPGGESTTIGKLLLETGLFDKIKELAKNGIPIMGTCAGAILLAKKGDSQVKKTKTKLLELIDIEVSRNSFGRQKDSFEKEIEIKGIGNETVGKEKNAMEKNEKNVETFNGIFIRAPSIKKIFGKAKAIAFNGKEIVGTEQDNIIALTFHPELADDLRVHEMFLKKCLKSNKTYT